jgi:hypothetical protein
MHMRHVALAAVMFGYVALMASLYPDNVVGYTDTLGNRQAYDEESPPSARQYGFDISVERDVIPVINRVAINSELLCI